MSIKLSSLSMETATLVSLLQERSIQHPDQLAYTFFPFQNAEDESLTLTYRELDMQARAIATILQNLGSTKKLALLLYPSGLDYITAFFGCLYAKTVAITAYPPDSTRIIPRIQAIVRDAEATLVLTTRQVKADVQRWFTNVPDLERLEWLTTDDIPLTLADEWHEPEITPDTLAFLQYTSGSTAIPKGVMINHRNLIHNLEFERTVWGHTEEGVSVSWLPIFHDFGLIAGVLQPFYVRCPAYIMSPTSFVQRPMRWLEIMSTYRGTSTYSPNFGFELCIRKSTPEQRAKLDLSPWRIAANGAEHVRVSTFERFLQTFGPYGFRREAFIPVWGLAESTLIVTSDRGDKVTTVINVDKTELEQHRVKLVASTHPHAHPLVGCGATGMQQSIRIVHPQLKTTCPEHQVGEIWVSGGGVAQGYWQRPEETRQTFQAYLADTGEGPFLRTGDLGFLLDGELFITGRIKDVIIIRGANHYPQDIEITVEQAHSLVRPGCCAAFSIDVDDEERLVVVAEVDHRYPSDHLALKEEPALLKTIARSIREAVANTHDLRVYDVKLLKVGALQKTSSGKIQRSGCRAKYLDASLELWSGEFDNHRMESRIE